MKTSTLKTLTWKGIVLFLFLLIAPALLGIIKLFERLNEKNHGKKMKSSK